MQKISALLSVVTLSVIAGCGGGDNPTPAVDGGRRDGAARDAGPCTTAAQCDDGLFCTGTETCTMGRCEAGTAPCTTGMCSETMSRCMTTGVDADGDGDPATTDCDDADPLRFTGNISETNRCDMVDNDCNPATLGPDTDRDGYALIGCCNPQSDGTSLCGTDCDDTRDTVNNAAVESCNFVDDDCDGETDEGVLTTYYRDEDGDDFGRMDVGRPDDTREGCTPPVGYVPLATDCDDERSDVNPGVPERCNGGVDDNCDGNPDFDSSTTPPLMCVCAAGEVRPCGPTDGMGMPNTTGTCVQGSQECTTFGVWGACVGAVFPTVNPADMNPREERCDGVDEDCDGSVDEDAMPPMPTCYSGPAGTAGVGSCRAGSYTCTGRGGWVCMGEVVPRPSGTPQCGSSPSTDTDCDGVYNENVDCAPGSTGGCNDASCGGAGGSRTCTGSCTWGECVRSGGRQCSPTSRVVADCRSCGTKLCGSDCLPTGSCSYPTDVCGNGLDEDCEGGPDDKGRITCYRDFDMDSYRSGVASSQCDAGGGTCPAGYALLSRPEDCADNNALVNANCVLLNHYNTAVLNQCCHWSCPNPQTIYEGNGCPPGYRPWYSEARASSGGGNCSSEVNYGSMTVSVSTSCIGFEGSSCYGNVTCRAFGL